MYKRVPGLKEVTYKYTGSVDTPPMSNEKPAEVMGGFEPPLKVLQTSTLPLGHMTLLQKQPAWINRVYINQEVKCFFNKKI